jgi:hypothetical protein
MAVAADLDRATDSQWDWVAEQTRTYLSEPTCSCSPQPDELPGSRDARA